MVGERAVEARERAIEVSTRREQQATAPRQDRQRPRTVDSLGARLPEARESPRLVEPAERDQRLEQVAELQALCRLEHEGMAKVVRASEVGERSVGVSERQLDEAEHPRVAGLADAERLGLGAGQGCVDRVRASSMRPRCAAMNAAGNSSGGIRRPSWVIRSTDSNAYRSASSQLPARHSRWDMFQRAPLRASDRSAARDGQHLVVERTRPVDLCRPDELVPEVEGRAVVEWPAWQRPLEDDRVFHRRARNATPGIEVHVPVGPGRDAAECNVVDARGGLDGERPYSTP